MATGHSQPNIVLIMTDQHRLSALSCYGDTPCRTPNLDRLASSGVRFETAYTSCTLCSPARATIMTGLYPHSHGVCSNVHDLGCSVNELLDRPALLSRRLQTAGYACGYTGKWHLGTDSPTAFGTPSHPSLPRDVGFHGQNFPGHGDGGFRYPEYRAYLAEKGFEHRVYQRRPDDARGSLRIGLLEGPVEATVDYFLAEHTIQLIDRFHVAGNPFFIWHNFWGPHSPYWTPLEFYEMYRQVEIPEWPNYRWPARAINGPHQMMIHPQAGQMTWEDWAEAIRYYYAFTSLIDSQIGRLVDHLEQSGLLQNTIIIFTADHGETLGSHGGLRDKGWCHFEEIQRIPMIVWLPERYYDHGRKPGDSLSEWASLVDVYPTILDLAGVDLSEADQHGRSLLPLVRGEPVAWRDSAFIEFHGLNHLSTSMVTIRHADLKYGWNCTNQDELYDLANDPYETTNLIADPAYANAASEMRQRIEAWMAETRYPGLSMYRRSRLGVPGQAKERFAS
jgi:arylsulfatase A-like enzyme